jgi:hypothetical protein
MSNTETNAATFYADFFKKWQGAGMLKMLGAKPTAEQLATAHHLGCKPGKQAFAVAMSLRDCGVTGSQIVIACGAPQLNKMRGFVTDALLREVPTALLDGHKVYHNAVTPKGQKRIDAMVKASEAKAAQGEAEAVKAPKVKAKVKKATSKARKGNGKATAQVPANELVLTDQPVMLEIDRPENGDQHVTELPENQL